MRALLLVLLLAGMVYIFLQVTDVRKNALPPKGETAPLDKAKMTALQFQFNDVGAALTQAANEAGEMPGSLDTLFPRFLRRQSDMIDPWGTPLRLEKTGTAEAWLVSAGPDHLFGTSDDVKRRV